MFWNVEDRGFLPTCDPLVQIPISNYKNTQLIFTIENLAHMMPCFLAERRWREELLYELRQLISKFGDVLIDKFGSPAEVERVFLLLNMFAIGYLFAEGESPLPTLPKELSVPLARAAKICGRRPTLDYSSYVLYNWQKSNNNYEPLVTFTDTAAEKELIAVFVAQEFELAEMINSRKADDVGTYMSKWKITLTKCLARLRNLRKEELQVIGEYLNDDLFTQAPIFSMLLRLFVTDWKDPLLQKAEVDICEYRPGSHNQFIASVNPMANLVEDRATLDVFNECLQLAIDLHNDTFMIRSQEWKLPRVHFLKKCFRQGVK